MSNQELREPTMLVLTSLAGGRKHGYALIGDTEQLSEGRVRLKVGTLYAVLDRLLEQGLIAEAGSEVVEGRARKYFELTEDGADRLAVEVRRLEANAAAAKNRLRAWGPGIATIASPVTAGGTA